MILEKLYHGPRLKATLGRFASRLQKKKRGDEMYPALVQIVTPSQLRSAIRTMAPVMIHYRSRATACG